MNHLLLPAIAGILSGMAGSMGLGGGSVLLLYLTLFAGMDQLKAQGINLAFFVPIAIFALILHAKTGYIRWKVALVCAVTGLVGAVAGTFLANYIGNQLLSKIFAFFLLLMGAKEIFSAFKKDKKTKP